MTEITKSALLCPVKVTDEGIEVFMTRRNFCNYQKSPPLPMRYPGEWVFAGGAYEKDKDKYLSDTAIREFREETGYEGKIIISELFHTATQNSQNQEYYMEFYLAEIDPGFTPTIIEKAEIIDAGWMSVDYALELIQSEEFAQEQKDEIQKRNLSNPKYGIYAIKERMHPVNTIATLELIKSMSSDLLERYRDRCERQSP